MKDFIGTWRVAEVMTFNEETSSMGWTKSEVLLANPDLDKEYKMMAQAKAEFDKEQIHMLSPIPEGVSQEEIYEAVASGELVLKDGLMNLESFDWKIEDGKAYFNSHAEGEAFGEKLSPWVEIKEIGDMIELMTFHLIKE